MTLIRYTITGIEPAKYSTTDKASAYKRLGEYQRSHPAAAVVIECTGEPA